MYSETSHFLFRRLSVILGASNRESLFRTGPGSNVFLFNTSYMSIFVTGIRNDCVCVCLVYVSVTKRTNHM